MPALQRDETAFLVECEPEPAGAMSATHSPSASGDFGRDSRLSSYGSTSTASVASAAATSDRLTGATTPILASDPAKDPEQWPLLGAVLPPPGGWSRPSVPPGLTAADILPLAQDPFWCRVRAGMMFLFWAVMAALLASVVVIVVNDPQPCSARPPAARTTSALPPAPSLNVSLPLAAMQAMQVMAASRY